jgi:hypothetical protein
MAQVPYDRLSHVDNAEILKKSIVTKLPLTYAHLQKCALSRLRLLDAINDKIVKNRNGGRIS